MFEDIGNKIKILAKAICIMGVVASSIYGLFIASNNKVSLGIIIIVIGALVSWVGTFALYGFGELIDQTTQINKKLNRIGDNIARTSINTYHPEEKADEFSNRTLNV